MSFRPITIPLDKGLAQDLSPYGVSMPDGMQSLSNVAFNRKGAMTGRPSVIDHDEQAQDSPANGSSVALSSAVVAKTTAGIVAVNTPGGETPMGLWQGGQYVFSASGSHWLRTGVLAFTRKDVSEALGADLLLRGAGGTGGHVSPIPVGTNVVGRLSPAMDRSGIPFLGSNNEVQYRGTAAVTNIDAAGQANMAAAGNALFYHNTAGDVRVHLPGSLPTTSDVLIAAAVARTDTTPRMNMAAVLETGGAGYFVAWVSATAGRISLRRINTAGAVTATLDVNGLGTVLGVSLGISPANKLILGWIDSAAVLVKTKVFTTTTTVITDAALDVTYATPSIGGATSFSFSVGVSHLATGLVAFLGSTGNMQLHTRSLTTGVSSLLLTLYGTGAGSVTWEPLFNPVTFTNAITLQADTTLMGVQRVAPSTDYAGGTTDYNVGQSQWFVLNLTHLLNTGVVNYRGLTLAHGEWRGAARTKPTQAGKPTSTSLAFGLLEGTSFDTLGTSDVRAVRVLLALAPAAIANGKGGALLTNANAALHDGQNTAQHPFPETFADIVGLNNVAGGALAGGAYTYQATWEKINARGEVIRSGASEPATITAVAVGRKIQVSITVPQLLDYRLNDLSVTVKLWATQATPSAGAPLYFVGAVQQTAPASGLVTIEHVSEVDTTQPQLYTVGNVLDDSPPPAGDRGVAMAVNRMWVASQNKVYASKLLTPLYAPAWNTEGLHTLVIPESLGQVQGLAGYDDRLVVVCSSGVAVIRGPGVDDLGEGPGWALDVYQGNGSGVITPRRVVSTPDGVVYEGLAGSLWLVDVAGNRTRIDTSLAGELITGDVSVGGDAEEEMTTGSFKRPRRLYHGGSTLAVFDFEAGQWSTWAFQYGTYQTVINGVLWFQEAQIILSADQPPGTDNINGNATDYAMAFVTGTVRPAGGYSGWGRLRKVQLHGAALPNSVTLATLITADDGNTLHTSTLAVSQDGTSGIWPKTPYPELWMDFQRCRFFTVQMSITPAIVEIAAVDCWVSAANQAPNHNRG